MAKVPDYATLRRAAESMTQSRGMDDRVTIPTHATAERIAGGWFVEARIWVWDAEAGSDG